MLKLIILSISLVSAADQKQQSESKIFGGQNAKDGQFPYMAELSINYRGKFYHLCGGTIIHYNWILTAGHCAYYPVKTNSKINVTLGVTDITNGPHKWTTIVPTEDIIIHENYTDDGETAANDVALLRLRKTIFYGSKVLPVRLPNPSDSNSFEHQQGILSGWGLNENRNKNEPNILQFIEEEILSNTECSAQNANYPAIIDSEICISSKNGKTACPDDSGSPLVVKNDTVGEILVGIASYVDIGEKCQGDYNGPVVFMRVSYFMGWINEKTGIEF